MSQGRVLWYSDTIGYGFIHPDNGGGKLFVGCTNIADGQHEFLENGAKVTYEAVRSKEGMEAMNVSKI